MRNFVRKAIHTNSPPLVWPSNFHKIGLFAKKNIKRVPSIAFELIFVSNSHLVGVALVVRLGHLSDQSDGTRGYVLRINLAKPP